MKKATLLIGARITVKIPAHSIAPRLLLEWIGEYNFKNNNRPLLFTISLEDDPEELLLDKFKIVFLDLPKDQADNLLKYLNENLAL
jgi:hypothetical protein